MKIRVVGGGPAGLLFAQLVQRADPRHDVVVYERNRADDVFGFGVVFSDQALAGLKAADEPTQREIGEHSVNWQTIDVAIGGTRIRSDGHGFSAISRQRLLRLLQEGAVEAGVEVRYETDVTDLDELGSHDLLVGADGLNSGVRAHFADQLGARETIGRSKFIWCGSTTDWDSFRFIFEENAHGAFAVHGYPFDADTCTFLVETDEASWRAAGLDRYADQPLAPGESDTDSLRYLEDVFRDHLEGTQLIGNFSRWLNFRTIECDRWHAGNAVLLGDAAHTAHFSVGSGTTMAIEDAIALNASLADEPDLETALTIYEQRRRPAVEYIQRAAEPSLAWWESFPAYMRKPPEQFMFHFLTRTPQVTRESLRLRDRRLVRQVDRWWAGARTSPVQPESPAAADALAAPITVGGLTLGNRVVAAIPAAETPYADETDAWTAVGLARSGAGLVLSPPIDLPDPDGGGTAGSDAELERWRRPIAAVHETSHMKIGLTIRAPMGARSVTSGASKEISEAVRQADAVGFDLICVRLGPESEGIERGIATVRRLRATWPPTKGLATALVIEDVGVAEDYCGTATQLAAAGCDLIGLSLAPSATTPDHDAAAWRVLALSEQIRETTGLPTMIDGCVTSDDYARTAVLSGRADLCCGYPQLGTGRWRLHDHGG